jgi:hypothetical protein
MIKFMALMNFPRYINTESRDFFYLTLRHVLPGEPIAPVITPSEPGEGAWRVHDLPQQGWPYALATTNLRPEATRPATRVGLIKIDPKMIRAYQPGEADAKTVVEFRAPKSDVAPALALWHSDSKGFAIANLPPNPKATAIAPVLLPDDTHALPISAALGIDQGGMLVYARVTEGLDSTLDPALLKDLLKRLGCEQIVMLPKPLGVLMGESNADPGSSDGVRFVRAEGPQARRIFPDTPIVSPKRWAPLQQRKSRPD